MFSQQTWKNFDGILLLATLLIFGIGLAFLYSATYQYSYKLSGILPQSFLMRQIIWFAFSIIIGAALVKIDYQKWVELAYPLYGLNLVLLLLVPVLGETILGAQRWISVSNIGFQPSEFSKIIIILTLARYLGGKEGFNRNLFRSYHTQHGKELAASFLIVGLPFLLILNQPDLGTALTLIPILFAILYVWGVSRWTLVFIFFTGLLSSPLLWQVLKDYQKRRIMVFLNPNLDPLGAGYTVIQSKIAIGSGRLLGKGWLSGTQNQLNFLPERHTDFIFSVVGEEWGFVGAMLVLVLYLVLIWRAYSCAQRTTNVSARLLACGIIVMLSFQVLVNIAMTMGLVPVVGLPLPLISYGGSSLLTTMLSIAFLLNLSLRHS